MDQDLAGKKWELCVHSHLLSLLAFAQHMTSTFPQDSCFHLIVDHKGLLCGMDIQTARSHFALGDDEQTVKLNSRIIN